MDDPRQSERRKKTRVAFQTVVELTVEGRPVSVKSSSDISLKGLFVETGAGLALGTPCQVTIRLAGYDENLTLHIEGEVARCQEDGLGIRFTSMDPDTFFHLRNIVLYNAADPDEVEAELARPGFLK